MSGAHGVVGWVWCGGGWVSVDRQLFPPFVVSGWLWSCRVWNAAEVGVEGSREGILYDEIYITILN